jgi:DNA-binding transcriptional ArsR family regulator
VNESTLNELGNLFLALSDKTRLRLLGLMTNGEVSVGFLADSLGESQPKISRHLAYLRSAGLVSTRRDGKWIYYNIQRPEGEVAGNVMNAALGRPAASKPTAEIQHQEEPRPTAVPASGRVDEEDFYIDDWQPQELEVFLL